MRPYGWFCHFSEFGVRPVVVTRQWDALEGDFRDYIRPGDSPTTRVESGELGVVLRAPYFPSLSNRMLLRYGERGFRLLRKALTASTEILQYFLPVGPKREIYKSAREYLKGGRVDVIIATGDPFVLFHYAALLSKEFGIPWVADYRDTWSQDKTGKNALLRALDSRIEMRTLKSATGIVTVSEFLVAQIRRLVRDKEFKLVLNGYDQATSAAESVNQGSERFTIAFAGTIYAWHPIESFLRVCDSLFSEGQLPELNLEFYGVSAAFSLRELLDEKYPALAGVCHISPKLPAGKLAKEMARANLLLLFNDYAILGTKIFTYLRLRRKILLCYTKDARALRLKEENFCLDVEGFEDGELQAEVVRETGAGVLVENEAGLREVLLGLHREFQASGSVECKSRGIERYSRRIQVKELSEWLKQICGRM